MRIALFSNIEHIDRAPLTGLADPASSEPQPWPTFQTRAGAHQERLLNRHGFHFALRSF